MIRDVLITDFENSLFTEAFQAYFAEFDIHLKDGGDSLWKEFNEDGNNVAFLRVLDEERAIGFVLVQPLSFSCWFFKEQCGFIREFWVAPEYRNEGHGSSLLALAEQYFLKNDMTRSVLTTDTAEQFYRKRGYTASHSITSKNGLDVFVKDLFPYQILPVKGDDAADAVNKLYDQNREALHGEDISGDEWKEIFSVDDPDEAHFLVYEGIRPHAWLKLNGLDGVSEYG